MGYSTNTVQLCTPLLPRVESPFRVAGCLFGVRCPVLPFKLGPAQQIQLSFGNDEMKMSTYGIVNARLCSKYLAFHILVKCFPYLSEVGTPNSSI